MNRKRTVVASEGGETVLAISQFSHSPLPSLTTNTAKNLKLTGVEHACSICGDWWVGRIIPPSLISLPAVPVIPRIKHWGSLGSYRHVLFRFWSNSSRQSSGSQVVMTLRVRIDNLNYWDETTKILLYNKIRYRCTTPKRLKPEVFKHLKTIQQQF